MRTASCTRRGVMGPSSENGVSEVSSSSVGSGVGDEKSS